MKKYVCKNCGMLITGAVRFRPFGWIVHTDEKQCLVALKAHYSAQAKDKEKK